MSAIQQITRLAGAGFSPPSGGWEGCDPAFFNADMSLLDRLRELARKSVSDPGCNPELEQLRTLREVPAADLRVAVAHIEQHAARHGWRLVGTDDQPIHDRIDEHYAIPQRRARGLVAA